MGAMLCKQHTGSYICFVVTFLKPRSIIRPRKMKGLFALLAWKSGLLGWIFFFFWIWTQKKCSIIHVCAFLDMQSHRIGLILVLEVVFHTSGQSAFLGQLLNILTFCFNIFVWKCKMENQNKKQNKQTKQTNKTKQNKTQKWTDRLFSNILGGSEKGKQTPFLRPYQDIFETSVMFKSFFCMKAIKSIV